MKTIFAYLKPFVPRMTLGLTVKFTGSAVELLLPWILSYMIDEVAPTKDMTRIAWWGAAMVLARRAAGERMKDAVRQVSAETGLARNELCEAALKAGQ